MGRALKRVNKNKIRVIAIYFLAISIVISSSSFVLGVTIKSDLNENIQNLSFTIHFEKPSLNEIALNGQLFTKISMKNCISYAKIGSPSLPINPIKILLPQGKKLSKIDVSVSDSISIKCDILEKPVAPQQEPILIGMEKSDFSFKMNKVVYNSPNPVLKNVYSDVNVDYCRGYAILSIMLNPVQYTPKNGKVFYYPDMIVTLELEEDNLANQFYRNNFADEEWVGNLVVNPEETESYGSSSFPATIGYTDGLCDSSDDYDYVIITTTAGGLDDWEASSIFPYNWTSLMDKHTSDDGLSCTLVTIQDISSCSDYWNDTARFNDTTAHIREFCKDAYRDWNASYILIGGDDNLIPARKMDYAYESDVESDIYFSNLDSSFNDDEDEFWGESGDGGFDLYSELYIGRLTCDEPQDVSNWMNKSFTYADSVSADYLENAGFYGGDTGWEAEGDDFIEYSAIQGTTNWLGPNPSSHGSYPSWLGFQFGFETWNNDYPDHAFDLSEKWTAEPTNTGWSGGNDAAAIAGLKNAINNDDITLLSGIAHANEYMSLDVTYVNWESDYHNTKPFFIHDYGCHSGDMAAADDGVIHSMLFHSDTELAFGCVYNTGYGWGSYYDTNSSSALQQKLFWNYFFDLENNSESTNNWQLGKAMAYSKDAMAPTINWTYVGAPESWRGVIQGCLLFADPAQKLKSPNGNVPNSAPVQSGEAPTNGSTGVEPTSTLYVLCSDADGDTMAMTWNSNSSGSWAEFENDGAISTGTNISHANSNFSGYGATYWWSVNITGTDIWTNETYHFTTRSIHEVLPPDSFTATTYNNIQINLTWNKDSNATHTYIERNTTTNWSKGGGVIVCNTTGDSYSDNNLTQGTTYYYQAWGWDNTDKIWSSTNTTANDITSNSAPVVSNESPTATSTDQALNPSLSISVSDNDGDLMNATFYSNSSGSWTLIGYNESSQDGIYAQTTVTFNEYETKYWWSVNCTDGYTWTNETYYFTTVENQPPSFSSISPSSESTGVSISTSTLSLTVTDLEGDLLNWAITTSPNIGSNSGNNDPAGSKSCSISGLNYNTKYYWSINVYDTGSLAWSNATYWLTTENSPPQNNPPGGGGGYAGGGSAPPPTQNNKPSKPDGPLSGFSNVSYTFSTSSNDSDDNQIKYKFDWGDGTTSEWTELIESGIKISLSHSWTSNGTYNVKAMAKDENGGQSSWSEFLSVKITDETLTFGESDEINIVLNVPENNFANKTLSFDILDITGLENENLTYFWDFGDGTNGTEEQPNHSYSTPGIYTVTLMIYDDSGSLVNTTTFEVTIADEANAKIQTVENEIIEENNENPLLIILFGIGGAIVVCIILLLRKLISVSQKDEDLEPMFELSKKVDEQVEKIKMFDLGPKNMPNNLPTAKYDHDLVNSLLDESLEIPQDLEFNEEQNFKKLRKQIDELIFEENKEE